MVSNPSLLNLKTFLVFILVFLEIFAGRIYEKEAGEGLRHMRKVLQAEKK